MDTDFTDTCSRTLTCNSTAKENDNQGEISSSLTNSNLICMKTQILASKMLSESMSCLNDDFRHDLFPHSPDSAELSTISLPNSGPHDTILSDPMPPRPSSEGDQPSSTNTKSFKCTKCPYVTDRKNNLKRHMTTMHDPAPSTLDCCGTRFATKGDLRDHTKAAHGAGYTCWQCGHNFCRRALLQRHQSVHSGHKAFSCSKCGYQSSHKSNMQRHMQVHLQAKASDSPGLKDRFKNTGKGTFRSPSWKCSNVLSRQNYVTIERGTTVNNLKGLLEQQSSRPANVDPESKISASNFKQPILVNQNVFYPSLHHGQFSKALSAMAAANLSVTFKNHESQKMCETELYSASQSITNSAGSFSPEIWRRAFEHQNKPKDVNGSHLKVINSKSSDSDHLMQTTASGIHEVASKLVLPELHFRSSDHQEPNIAGHNSSRVISSNFEPGRLVNKRTSDSESSGARLATLGTASLGGPSGHSAFVQVRPFGGRIHRPIPRYGNRALDFSINRFLPSTTSTQQSPSGRGIQSTTQIENVPRENNCRLTTAMLFASPNASEESLRRIQQIPNLSSSPNVTLSSTTCDGHTHAATIEHPHLLPISKLESTRSNFTSKNHLETHLNSEFTVSEQPLSDVATTPLEPIDYSMQKKTVCSDAPKDDRIQATSSPGAYGHSANTEAEVTSASTCTHTSNSRSILSLGLGWKSTPVGVSNTSLVSSSINQTEIEVENSDDSCRTHHFSLGCAVGNDFQNFVTDYSGGAPAMCSESENLQHYIPKKLRASRKKDI